MKIAFSSNAFRKYSLIKTIDILAEAGYKGIEIMCDVPHAYPPDLNNETIAGIKRHLKEKDIRVSNLNAFMMTAIGDFHHPSWIEKDKAQRELRINHTIGCIRLAKELGVETISTEPGGPVDGMGMDRTEAMKLFIDGINRVVDVAKPAGIKVLVEPEPDLLIQTSTEFKEFIQQVDTETVALNCDLGHHFCVGEDPCQVLEEFNDLIYHIHIEDIAASREHVHVSLGKGAMDFNAIFRTLKKIDYQGWITVELYPYEDNPGKTAAEALDYLIKLEETIDKS
jgi:sugar phosphate isomerase/epimerase